jgi:hypothetical protein
MPFQKREYWYIAFLHNGVPVVWLLENVHNTQEANTKGFEKLNGRLFQTFALGTKDMSKANEHARAILLEESGNVDAVLHRARHTDIKVENAESNTAEL